MPPTTYIKFDNIEKKEKAESSRRERIEQFKGIRKQEREKVCNAILNRVYESASIYNEGIYIIKDTLERIIEEIKKGEQ